MVPYLVQYSIRSKQDYIFRTNRMREVTGASALIANVFSRLLDCAISIGLKVQAADGQPFSLEKTLAAFADGSLQVAELFQGGGNDTLLVDSGETFRRLNEVFTHDLLVHTPGMIPLCVGVPVSEEQDYQKDYRALSLASSREKSVMVSGLPHDGLPFSMLDTLTHLPFQPVQPAYAKGRRLTAESLAKQDAYLAFRIQDETVSDLDDLLGKDDSMLAIVHADGNNMGKKLRALLGQRTDYDSCVAVLRAFSREIDDIFVAGGDQAIEREKEAIRQERGAKGRKEFLEIRSMISDGDDYTFVCNAKWVLRLTRAYLASISAHEGYSACAGICLFHRHYPFARAYDLAEQACENAKKKVHTAEAPDQCWFDFHYLHGGVPDDLEETRQEHGTDRCVFRPWRCDSPEDPASVDRLIRLNRMMMTASGEEGKTTRSNLKALGSAMEVSESEAEKELRRICFRAPGLQEQLAELFPEKKARFRAIYDLSETYDLWFDVREAKQHGEN